MSDQYADFWEDSEYARREYVDVPITPELVASVEAELGFRLPKAYVDLMRSQNGGLPRRSCFPTEEETSWAEDHVAITGFYAIGREKRYSLLGELGSVFMQQEWGYPTFGVCICDCPSAGHDLIMLDYRAVGPEGEPCVVHVDQESDFKVTLLAPDFATFVAGLVSPDVYDNSEAELAEALQRIGLGAASWELKQLFSASSDATLEAKLRNLLGALTKEKGYFALHADPLSYLAYDLLFDLYVQHHGAVDPDAYLKAYPKLLAMADAELSTRGYAPSFVEAWLDARLSSGAFVETKGRVRPSDAQREQMLQALAEYR